MTISNGTPAGAGCQTFRARGRGNQTVLASTKYPNQQGSTMKKLVLLLALGASLPAIAQEEKGGNVRYARQTEINFEDDTIEGDLSRPDGEYVEARKKVPHSNLIRIREEFKDKVLKSVGEL